MVDICSNSIISSLKYCHVRNLQHFCLNMFQYWKLMFTSCLKNEMETVFELNYLNNIYIYIYPQCMPCSDIICISQICWCHIIQVVDKTAITTFLKIFYYWQIGLKMFVWLPYRTHFTIIKYGEYENKNSKSEAKTENLDKIFP